MLIRAVYIWCCNSAAYKLPKISVVEDYFLIVVDKVLDFLLIAENLSKIKQITNTVKEGRSHAKFESYKGRILMSGSGMIWKPALLQPSTRPKAKDNRAGGAITRAALLKKLVKKLARTSTINIG